MSEITTETLKEEQANTHKSNGNPSQKIDLFTQYVNNHHANMRTYPIAYIIVGLLIAMWVPWQQAALWVLLTNIFHAFFSYSSIMYLQAFDNGKIKIDADLKPWIYKIGIPRLFFIITWASVVIWAWDFSAPESYAYAVLLVFGTMAINASTSGPFLPYYFMELAPKATLLIGYSSYLSLIHYADKERFFLSIAITAVIGTLLVIRIAKRINDTQKTLIKQRNNLAQAKEEVERASSAKSAFLATMSHEVRTPLNGVLGIVNLLKTTKLDTEQDGYVETIRYSGDTLLAMLNDILDFSKMEAGKLTIEKIDLDLKRLIKSVSDLMYSRANDKDIKIHYETEPDVPQFIQSDPTRLRQVLLNLVSNAIKFTDKGAVTIRVRTIEKNNNKVTLRFEVIDSGIGISKGMLPNLFKEFAQADSSITRRYGGTGLGLSICQKIIEILDGKIGAESIVGNGSTFWFEIPTNIVESNESTLEEEERARGAFPDLEPLSILLVEDNKVNQQVVTGLLKKCNHSTTIAENGQEAVDMLHKRQDFDVILMDMMMPVKDGLQATREIKAIPGKAAKIPIIALTANAMRGDDQRCLAAGMVDHVAKPLDPTDLFWKLAKHVPSAARGKINITTTQKQDAHHINLSALTEIEKTLGKNYIVTFIQQSLPEVHKIVSHIEKAKDSNAIAEMLYAAHELKSLSAMFGMIDLQSIAEGIEMCCLENKGEEAHQLAKGIDGKFINNVLALQKIYPIDYTVNRTSAT